MQYCFDRMAVLEAWRITKGSDNVLIGVVEKGFDPTHEELKDGVIEVFEIAGMEHPKEWMHQNHGTEIVSQIVAKTNNGKGIAGLAPECRVVVAATGTHKSFGERTAQSADEWNRLIGENSGEAIRYLVDRGCKVINCSYTTATTPAEAFEYAIAHDVVVVVASGNFNRDSPQWPIGVIDVLGVGGVDTDDKRWINPPVTHKDRQIVQGSNYGRGLSVVAPCRDLVVCIAGDENIDRLPVDGWVPTGFGQARKGYLWKKDKGGTSNAAPMASALAGLIRSARPDLTHQEVIRIIERGADDLESPGWDQFTGYGRINFQRSLELAIDWPRDE
jgi:subtilisin family serine protease